MAEAAGIYRKLQISGGIVALGLLFATATRYWAHPLAFVLFILVGGTLVGAGVLFYLYSIVSH
jgi:hypothetical protein